MAIEKDLLKAGAEQLGMLFDGWFEQALLPKAAILLPAAPTAPSLLSVGTSIRKDSGKYPSTESRLVMGQFLDQVPHSAAQSLCHPRRERGGAVRGQGQENHIFPWHCRVTELAELPEGSNLTLDKHC